MIENQKINDDVLKVERIDRNIATFTITEDMTSIGERAFEGCKNLKEVTIPPSVTSIGEYAFYGCKNLKEVTIPSTVTEIGSYAFSNCENLKDVTIQDGVTSIPDNCFSYCKSLKNVSIPDGVTEIKKNAFSDCGFTKVTIPSKVTSIGERAFYSCGLETVEIPDGVTEIGDLCFGACYDLIEVTIPSTVVTNLKGSAFYYCERLRKVNIVFYHDYFGGINIDKKSEIITDMKTKIKNHGLIYNVDDRPGKKIKDFFEIDVVEKTSPLNRDVWSKISQYLYPKHKYKPKPKP